jgi:transposase
LARYKPYNYSQSMILPVILEQQIIPGTIEFAIHYLVDHDIDTCVLDQRFNNDDTGRRAYDPRVLLKIVLLAYSRGIIHSRKIERVCRENITFMALTCGQSPDHSTIASFVSSMKDEIGPLFSDVLLICEEMRLLSGTAFSLDGCKLASNASKEWSGKRKTLVKKQQKLEEKVRELMDRQIQADKEETDPTDLARSEKQIARIRQSAERIRKFLDENKERPGRKGKEIKSNITDNESANMKTSHGTVQGYNGQALVNENQIILGAGAFGSGQDYDHLEPMVEEARRNLERIGYPADYFKDKTFLADSNYHCESNLRFCDKESIDAYIPDVNFRKRDERFETQSRHKPKRDRFTTSDFTYDEARDVFICPQGRELTLRAKRAQTQDRVHRRYVIKGDDCTGCPFFSKCLEEKRGGKRKHLHVRIEKKESFHQQMMEKIDTEEGRIKYGKRLGMVEPVFGNIRIHKRLDRFTLRGRIKVNIQWLLYCMVHNIGKLCNHGYGYAVT